MIEFQNAEVVGWKHAIRGMRNPMNSWDRSDGGYCCEEMHCGICPAYCESEYGFCALDNYSGAENYHRNDQRPYVLGLDDRELAANLAASGSVHAKYRRMIVVYVDILAPLYWWKEFDTYKVGTVANSCSTMHKIHAKEFTIDDFSHDHLLDERFDVDDHCPGHLLGATQEFGTSSTCILEVLCDVLNHHRKLYLETKDKEYWWQLIQLLPSSYNQKRTVMLNYEVLAGIYLMRKDHKFDEWRSFCKWIKSLPYSVLIVGDEES